MQPVLVKPIGHDEEPWFRTNVVDFEPDRELVIGLPSARDRLLPKPKQGEADADPEDDEMTDIFFNRGAQLEIQLIFPDGIRRFNSVIRRLDLSFGGSIYLEWPSEGTRIQRREHVRVEVRYPTQVRFTSLDTDEQRSLSGDTIDVSAGGVRLLLSERIPDDTEVDLAIDAEALRDRAFKGRVVRSGEIEARRIRRDLHSWVAVEFVGLDPRARKEMTQLVFDIQRQQMRRTL